MKAQKKPTNIFISWLTETLHNLVLVFFFFINLVMHYMIESNDYQSWLTHFKVIVLFTNQQITHAKTVLFLPVKCIVGVVTLFF